MVLQVETAVGEAMARRTQRKSKTTKKFEQSLILPESTTAILRLDLLRTYKPAWLPGDLLAGLVVFAVTIPSALAYSGLAGLAPIHGLFASLLAMLVYSFFGTSRQLILGSEATVAILVASTLAGIAAGGDPTRYALLAMMQAVVVGVIQVIAGVVRTGFIADFIPKSVVIGFINGMALIIIASRVEIILGIEITQSEFFPQLWEYYTNIPYIHWPSLVIGGACLLGLLLFRSVFPIFPEAVLVVVLATMSVTWLDIGAQGIELVGLIPAGLPRPTWPEVGFTEILEMVPLATGIALFSFIDVITTGRAFSTKGGYRIEPDQELIALGLANVGSGLCQGFCLGGSQSRTVVNNKYGGKS
jgi:MFS superfamily sulfate permease-like transporter